MMLHRSIAATARCSKCCPLCSRLVLSDSCPMRPLAVVEVDLHLDSRHRLLSVVNEWQLTITFISWNTTYAHMEWIWWILAVVIVKQTRILERLKLLCIPGFGAKHLHHFWARFHAALRCRQQNRNHCGWKTILIFNLLSSNRRN